MESLTDEKGQPEDQEDLKSRIYKQSFKVCFCFKRIFKLKLPDPAEDVKMLFEKYSPNGTMSQDDLQRFLIEYQREDNTSAEDAQAIFNSLKHLGMFHRRGLDLTAFMRYLVSDRNAALSPSLGVHHNMNAPLSHYFLYTGHNSYLTGNQLSSDSSVEPIKDALRRGVRVIELDLWPSSNKEKVEVRHGGTLTSPVDLIKCLRVIRENAFCASEYPVIITFEDHLNANLQVKVAMMVTKTFGDMLYCPGPDQLREFPSPESLKKRVLISTKPPKEYLETQRESSGDKENPQRLERPSKGKHLGMERIVSERVLKTYEKDRLREEEYSLEDDDEKTVDEYRRLIAIHAGKLKGGLDKWLSSDGRSVRRLSLSEEELENATRTHGTDIVRFTQRNLLRVYPKGLRLDSSNYDPFIGWMHGAQMVAFNMQNQGKFLWIMQGMFRANGGCGYVKKPDFLLHLGPNNEVFDPSMALPIKKYLKIKICTGEGWDLDFHHTDFDLFSPPDFYVKVGIAGVPADKVTEQTKIIPDNWQPHWNEEFVFPLTVPELAVLRIEVCEYDIHKSHDFAGQTCLPVSELRTGIRAIPLHDRKGNKYRSVNLLVQISFV